MENRREFLFLYDGYWANPNGDPLDENKPRIDEETGLNYVTDVRLKRTIRDQLSDMGFEVFLVEERKDGDKLKTREELFQKYQKGYEEILDKCIDIRLFGGTFSIENNTKSFTGPVQFKFGRSLHRVKLELVKGTTILPSKKENKQGTFTEMYVLPYFLIVFYGIANENAAKLTRLKDEDINAMLRAMWIGHKSSTDLISRSKFGHEPRLLIEIIYKKNTQTQMGELDKLVRIKTDKKDEEIRDIEEVTIDLSKLKEKVEKYKNKIEKVRYIIGDRVKLNESLEEVFKDIPLEEFEWAKDGYDGNN
ncbi:MAG: type I-B CRISPR-associated protein Cas7/Csh2 [Brevinematia bacterium]